VPRNEPLAVLPWLFEQLLKASEMAGPNAVRTLFATLERRLQTLVEETATQALAAQGDDARRARFAHAHAQTVNAMIAASLPTKDAVGQYVL
jgi:hypothetical protein